MKRNFDEDNLELTHPRRFQVYKRLFEGFKKSRQQQAIDYADPRFRNPDGTVNNEAIKKYADELAEKELAEHAYILSEFMSAKATRYQMIIGLASVSRKYLNSADYIYSPNALQIRVSGIKGEDTFEANGSDMIYDGYKLLVVNDDITEEITLDVDYGIVNFALKRLIGLPESFTVRLIKHGKWEDELVQETVVSVVDIPYSGETYVDVDRGQWSEKEKYYAKDLNPLTHLIEQSHAWYLGCKYKNLVTGAKEPPLWDSKAWEFEEGNPDLVITWAGNEDSVLVSNPKLSLAANVTLYNQDLTDDPRVKWDWTRESWFEGKQDVLLDRQWNNRHSALKNRLDLTVDDMNYRFGVHPEKLTFIVTATLLTDSGTTAIRNGNPIQSKMIVNI